ncbi:MAG: hypothetical protein HY820_18915 [Acidobacteria bacterium]|nr:hypothetical protein [Acidobacteriota bacterium]
MKIQVDHVQRLNLHALLGAQRGDVATVRTIWALQDKLALTPEEEKAIELNREFIAGQERVLWNPTLTVPARELELTDVEIARVGAVLDSWATYGVAADRRWLEPLLRVFEVSKPA